MRQFYEQWEPVISNLTATAVKLEITTDEIETSLLLPAKSSVTTDDLESFLSLDFTHHIAILNGEKDASKRLKYIHLSLANRWNTKYLQQQIKEIPIGRKIYVNRTDLDAFLRKHRIDSRK